MTEPLRELMDVGQSSGEPCRDSRDPEVLSEKLRKALEMQAFGIELMRKNFERRNPNADPNQIDELLRTWLATQSIPNHLRRREV